MFSSSQALLRSTGQLNDSNQYRESESVAAGLDNFEARLSSQLVRTGDGGTGRMLGARGLTDVGGQHGRSKGERQ